MRVLDRKILRDLQRLWAQVIAIALVMACGVAVIILALGAYRSLEETRSTFYERNQFASVFASANRAPQRVKPQIEAIPGVALVETRIVKTAILDVLGLSEPARAIVLSLPDHQQSQVNRPYMRLGRLPDPERAGEVAVLETFAKAHGFRLGDSFKAIMNGKRRVLTIVGTVLSPEYIYAIGPGDFVPDQRRFGVLYLSHREMAAIFDQQGAFNNVVLTILRDADTRPIIDALDRLLKPYGGTGAHDRAQQTSHAFLDSELQQLKAMSFIVPPIFLAVSAFLLNMILSRLVALEREQIGLLKALGYTNAAIAVHYSKLVIAIAIIGISIGFVFGWWMGRGLTRMYSEFFTFPFLIFQQNIDLYVISAGVTIASALAGAANAIWSTVSLAPAVAMRPPAPARYRTFFSSHSGKLRFVSQLTTMALRHILRQPLRAFFTSLGVAMSVALLITATFFFDAIDAMIDTVFFQIERQDATITFAVQQHPRALYQVQRLPGVLRAEPFRATPVLLSNANRSVRTSIMAGWPDAQLSRLLDGDMKPMKPTPEGIFLSERVAAKLGVGPGQVIDIRLYEQDNRMARVSVVGISQSLVGLSANMSGAALDKLMRNGKRISGAHLSLDSNQLTALYDKIKATPMIAGLALQGISRQKFRDTIGENIGISAVIYVFLSVVITFGVVYNSARIQLSERARELASLRVFGFTRSEVSSVLLLELGIMVFMAQPLGWLLGYGLCRLMVVGFENDLFRIPFIILPATYAVASLVVLAASIISALVVRRRIDRLDLIRVLKTRE